MVDRLLTLPNLEDNKNVVEGTPSRTSYVLGSGKHLIVSPLLLFMHSVKSYIAHERRLATGDKVLPTARNINEVASTPMQNCHHFIESHGLS